MSKTLKDFVNDVPNAIFRKSKRGVPHVVIGSRYSICWFNTKKVFRIFDGYAIPDNHKIKDCLTYDEVIDFFMR